MFNQIIKRLYHQPIFSALFHTVVHELQRELEDCQTVLDLGCGPESPLEYCSNIKYSVGVEPFSLYVKKSKANQIHTRYIQAKIEDLTFPDKSFDAVVMVEVLEHLPKAVGLEMLMKMSKWAKKIVIVTTPNGFIAQKSLDGNILQQHLSGWNVSDMKKLGFQVNGLAGLKLLRQELPSDMVGDDLTAAIRWRPKLLWFVIATLSQALVFYYPGLGFELFNVKTIK